MANSILFTYYTLESKNTYGYHYYYFAGYDDAGNMLITDEPGNAVAFRHNKEAKNFLKNHQDLTERFEVQTMFTNTVPRYYVEFKPITEIKTHSLVQKIV